VGHSTAPGYNSRNIEIMLGWFSLLGGSYDISRGRGWTLIYGQVSLGLLVIAICYKHCIEDCISSLGCSEVFLLSISATSMIWLRPM